MNDTPDRASGRDGRQHVRPRWVTVSAIAVGIAILLAIVVAVAGVGGDHGPGQHDPGRHGSDGGGGNPATLIGLNPPAIS